VTQPPDDLHRRQRLSILAAVEAALADPGRLITILTESEDDDDALRRVRTTFDLDDDVQAEAVLDLQVRRMTRANRVRIAEELRILRGDWGRRSRRTPGSPDAGPPSCRSTARTTGFVPLAHRTPFTGSTRSSSSTSRFRSFDPSSSRSAVCRAVRPG
jgi:hypothetical protein